MGNHEDFNRAIEDLSNDIDIIDSTLQYSKIVGRIHVLLLKAIGLFDRMPIEIPPKNITYTSNTDTNKKVGFNANVCIKLPRLQNIYLVTDTRGFKVIAPNLLEYCLADDRYQSMVHWLDDEEYLLFGPVSKWLYEQISQANKFLAMHTYWRKFGVKVKPKWCGTSVLVQISSNLKFSIDFIPILDLNYRFSHMQETTYAIGDFSLKKISEAYFVTEMSRVWRIRFFVNDMDKFKSTNGRHVLRLMKFFRNRQGMVTIKNYHLRAILINMDRANDKDPEFWKQPIGTLFSIAIEYMVWYISNNQYLPCVYNPYANLLSDIKVSQFLVLQEKLQLTSKYIRWSKKMNPKAVVNIFQAGYLD